MIEFSRVYEMKNTNLAGTSLKSGGLVVGTESDKHR